MIDNTLIYCRGQHTPEQDNLIASLKTNALMSKIGICMIILESDIYSTVTLVVVRWNFVGYTIICPDKNHVRVTITGRARTYTQPSSTREELCSFETSFECLATTLYYFFRKVHHI